MQNKVSLVKNYLAKYGWKKNMFGFQHGDAACLVGAINLTNDHASVSRNSEPELRRYIITSIKTLHPDRSFHSLVRFNDSASTTYDDLVEVLDYAEKLWETDHV